MCESLKSVMDEQMEEQTHGQKDKAIPMPLFMLGK